MSIEAMKQALEALEDGDRWEQQEAITSLRQAIAEAEKQEPVAKNEAGRITWLVDNWPQNCLLYTHPPQRQPLTDEQINLVREMRDVQGYDGNWNYDPYMQGLYNGLEFAVSLLERREPVFRDAPKQWLGDINNKRDKFNITAAHGIKGQP